MSSQIKRAILVILKVADEILVIKRQSHLKAFPGYMSFPGGKIEAEDQNICIPSDFNFPTDDLGAIVREIEEELGVNLLADRIKKQILDWKLVGKAITPNFNPVRFDSRTYLIELQKKVDIKINCSEIVTADWKRIPTLLEEFKLGKFACIPFFRKLLKHIQNNQKDVCTRDLIKEDDIPVLEYISGVLQIMPKSLTLPPADRTNSFILTDLQDILIDPSPRDEAELEEYFKIVSQYPLKEIFITHHHPDHHQFAEVIAEKMGLDLRMSSFTYQRLKDKFENQVVHLASDGDVLGTWKGRPITVYAVPGHDEGQLALAPQCLSWFLAGDLFQGIGTVVIPTKEGDMKKYFSSLQKVIDLRPAYIIPSHGIPLGDTYILEATLKHRKMREHQVRQLLAAGKNEREMLQEIYPDLPENIQRLALQNIKSHIVKIKAELS